MDISVVIPTYNRKDKLRQCLQALFEQDYPKDNFEIIVIDDGSVDGTEDMLKEISLEHINLKYFRQAHSGPAAARNFGIGQARSDIIAFTDNDCVVGSGWIKKMVGAHQAECDAAVIGGITRINMRNTAAAVSQFLSDGAISPAIHGKSDITFFPTCNASVKIKSIGQERFGEAFLLPAGEDAEFFWRIFKKGKKLIHRQEIEIFHDCHPGFRSFIKQAYMYGRGNYLVQYIHGDHPLFEEIKTKNSLVFLIGSVVNFMKITRFSYLLGRRLIILRGDFILSRKMQVYMYFALHKIMYILGNIAEHLRVIRLGTDISKRTSRDTVEEPDKPGFIILDVTHRCNLRCNICEIRKDKPIQEFTTKEIKNLISQAIEWGIKEFVLSGGEAFIREDIFEILEYTKDRKYHLGILTNGVLLNKVFISRLLPYLTSNALSLSISLDALNPNIHDDIRGARGCFEMTFHGLELLSELKHSYPNINFNVIGIILNKNLEELLELAKVLKSLNVDSVQFQPLLANNLIMKDRGKTVKYWIPKERLIILDRAVDALIEFKKNNPRLVLNSEKNLQLIKKYFRGSLTQKDVECAYATKTVLIANNGEVTTCFDSYGNVRNMSLRDIFYSLSAKKARDRVRNCLHPCLLPCFTDN